MQTNEKALLQSERQMMLDIFREEAISSSRDNGHAAKLLRLSAPNLTVGLLEIVCDHLVKARNVRYSSDHTNRLTHLQVLQKVPQVGIHPILRMAKSLVLGEKNYRPRPLIKKGQGIKFHVCPLSTAYIEKNNLDVVHSRHDEWYKPEPSPAVSLVHNELADWAIETVQKILFELGDPQDAELEKKVATQAASIVAWFDAQRQNLAGKKAPSFYVAGTVGMALNRIMAEFVRENGGHVIAVDHGNGIGMWDTDMRSYFELDWPHEFVTFGPEMATGAFLVDKADKRLNPLNKPNFTWAACSKKATSLNVDEAKSPACDVVQIAAPHIGDRASLWPYYPNEKMLNWQERLHRKLRSFGYRSAVKLHPESYHPRAMEIARDGDTMPMTEPFESIAWKNQVMIFEAATTVFRDALRFGLPIVFIELPRLKMLDHSRKFFEKRCVIVKGWLDDSGEVQVDWEELDAAIKKAPSLSKDTTMLNGYFPVKDDG
ncbi:hypothetical protein [uncultured Thalassospira sp.]|uniref:hypothetical protein n=1 Tax=uncultured Thalassospira sp. TaxID=404382 RepID=UPI00258542DB|nr:hypothetical protein [uncultured Thalassospira sp.]